MQWARCTEIEPDRPGLGAMSSRPCSRKRAGEKLRLYFAAARRQGGAVRLGTPQAEKRLTLRPRGPRHTSQRLFFQQLSCRLIDTLPPLRRALSRCAAVRGHDAIHSCVKWQASDSRFAPASSPSSETMPLHPIVPVATSTLPDINRSSRVSNVWRRSERPSRDGSVPGRGATSFGPLADRL
jgi:hypothetical protein